MVGQSHSKRNFSETIFLFKISPFFGSTTPSEKIHYFFDHIQTEMIENLFHEGHEEKTFFALKGLYEPLSGPELRSWIRFLLIEIFHIFSIFTYPENGPNMQKSRKILSKILKKVDRRKQGKGPQNPSKKVSHTFRASLVLRDANVCDSFTNIHARFSTIWAREDLVQFWAQIRTHRLADCT